MEYRDIEVLETKPVIAEFASPVIEFRLINMAKEIIRLREENEHLQAEVERLKEALSVAIDTGHNLVSLVDVYESRAKKESEE